MPQKNAIIAGSVLGTADDESVNETIQDWADIEAAEILKQMLMIDHPEQAISPIIAASLRGHYERGKREYSSWRDNVQAIVDESWIKKNPNPTPKATVTEIYRKMADQRELIEKATKRFLKAETFASTLLTVVEPMESQLKDVYECLANLVKAYNDGAKNKELEQLFETADDLTSRKLLRLPKDKIPNETKLRKAPKESKKTTQ